MDTFFAKLDDRRVLAVGGDDAVDFLQGLVTNDVTRPVDGHPVFAALLTPQGKFLHDFFVVAGREELLLDAKADSIDDLRRRLSLYRLRSKVSIQVAPEEVTVWAVWGPDAESARALDGAFADPRLPSLGMRMISNADQTEALRDIGFQPSTVASYNHWRLGHGVPDGPADLKRESSALLESNYDLLGAISWDKGCYMGQELTARTRYRGLVKRRLVQIRFDGGQPEFGTPIERNGRQVGEVRSTDDGIGLASMRLDALESGETSGLEANGQPLTARLPTYVES